MTDPTAFGSPRTQVNADSSFSSITLKNLTWSSHTSRVCRSGVSYVWLVDSDRLRDPNV